MFSTLPAEQYGALYIDEDGAYKIVPLIAWLIDERGTEGFETLNAIGILEEGAAPGILESSDPALAGFYYNRVLEDAEKRDQIIDGVMAGRREEQGAAAFASAPIRAQFPNISPLQQIALSISAFTPGARALREALRENDRLRRTIDLLGGDPDVRLDRPVSIGIDAAGPGDASAVVATQDGKVIAFNGDTPGIAECRDPKRIVPDRENGGMKMTCAAHEGGCPPVAAKANAEE